MTISSSPSTLPTSTSAISTVSSTASVASSNRNSNCNVRSNYSSYNGNAITTPSSSLKQVQQKPNTLYVKYPLNSSDVNRISNVNKKKTTTTSVTSIQNQNQVPSLTSLKSEKVSPIKTPKAPTPSFPDALPSSPFEISKSMPLEGQLLLPGQTYRCNNNKIIDENNEQRNKQPTTIINDHNIDIKSAKQISWPLGNVTASLTVTSDSVNSPNTSLSPSFNTRSTTSSTSASTSSSPTPTPSTSPSPLTVPVPLALPLPLPSTKNSSSLSSLAYFQNIRNDGRLILFDKAHVVSDDYQQNNDVEISKEVHRINFLNSQKYQKIQSNSNNSNSKTHYFEIQKQNQQYHQEAQNQERKEEEQNLLHWNENSPQHFPPHQHQYLYEALKRNEKTSSYGVASLTITSSNSNTNSSPACLGLADCSDYSIDGKAQTSTSVDEGNGNGLPSMQLVLNSKGSKSLTATPSPKSSSPPSSSPTSKPAASTLTSTATAIQTQNRIKVKTSSKLNSSINSSGNNHNSPSSSLSSTASNQNTNTNTNTNLDNYNTNSKYFGNSNGNHFIYNGGNTINSNNYNPEFDITNLRLSSSYVIPSSPSSTNSPLPSPSPSSSPSSFLSTSSLLPPSPGGNGSGGGGPPSNSFFAVCHCCRSLMARCCFNMPTLKAINVRRCVLALFAITVVTILYYTHYVDTGVFVGLIHRDAKPPVPIVNCRMVSGRGRPSEAPDHRSEARLRLDPKVLVFVETTYSSLARDIAELLVYNRIKYKIEVAGKSLPVLTNLDKGRYGVIVFENFDKYLNMDKWNRELLDKYCREYSVGIVGFVSSSEETLVAAQLKDFPIYVHTNLHLRDASLNPASPVLRLTRAGETAWGALPGDDWAVFQHNHSSYEPIEWAQKKSQENPSESDGGGQVQLPLTTILQDHGYIDGIQRVLFGSGLRFWLHRLVFLDALSYLSHGQLSLSLERMILVDIDDIFVGEKGTRLRPDDVRALIATQKIIASMVPGFRFNLGFSGKYYHHGTREENLGDDYLLQNVHEFNWFSHMWKHQQPHLYDNLTLLMSEMQLNYAFAKEHNIPTDSGYSISPHHSGVYPAHEILYVAWKKVWNVKVTSTEEYPHLRPARLRRGFIHRNIMVLPRQTCGLFTHTMYIDRYPGGRDKLDESIQGGELFQTIVYNPINIFMTHMSNYGSDRLALYTFQSVIKFLQCWTNIKLASAPPIQLAEMYFRLHPDEVDPVWGNPCDDLRHKKIWSKTKSCDSLPKFLVIGPQKTGTTALYTFLSMHPSIASNVPSPDTFEEIQFFNGNNYYRGLDWYMDFFPTEPNTTTSVTPVHSYMFEKSATYFDGEMVPKRAHALLPHAKIVTILISPAKRAYSWYQHQRAHGDVIANNYSFYQVITATDAAPKALKDLRNRCLNPGKYAQHLEHWLGYYPAQQLHIIDGEQLRSNPVDVMNDLQRFLKIQPLFDYTNHLRFDVKKGFFCEIVNEKRNKCLGKSKGRQYPVMDERSAKLLQRYYLNHNTALVKLLKKLGSRPIPQWLKDDLSTGT